MMKFILTCCCCVVECKLVGRRAALLHIWRSALTPSHYMLYFVSVLALSRCQTRKWLDVLYNIIVILYPEISICKINYSLISYLVHRDAEFVIQLWYEFLNIANRVKIPHEFYCMFVLKQKCTFFLSKSGRFSC